MQERTFPGRRLRAKGRTGIGRKPRGTVVVEERGRVTGMEAEVLQAEAGEAA